MVFKGSSLKSPVKCRWFVHSIELSFNDRRVDHEVELAFVMGEDRKDVNTVQAWNNIFGSTILLDISVCGDQDHSNRKSDDTFKVTL